MTLPNVVGFAGYAQSGKSTLASYLADKHGYNIVSFADGVRDVMKLIDPPLVAQTDDGWDRVRDAKFQYSFLVEKYGYEWTKAHTDARTYLVRIGDGFRQLFYDNFWVEQVQHKIMRGLREDPHSRWVVPDVRYPNEGNALLDIASVHSGNTARVILLDRWGVGPANDTEKRSIEQLREEMVITDRLHNGQDLHLTKILLDRLLEGKARRNA